MKKLIPVLLAVLLFSCPLNADKKVDELAAQAKARFTKFMEKVKCMTITTERGKLYYKGNKLRVDLNGDLGFAKMAGNGDGKTPKIDIRAIMIFNEQGSWLMSSIAGKQNMPNEKGVPGMRYMFERFWWTLDLSGAKLDGEEKVLDSDCYRIKFEKPDKLLPIKAVWVDKNNLMLVKDVMEMGPMAITTTQTDFRTVTAGFAYPMTTETEAGGRTVRSIAFGIDVKKDIDDNLYDPEKVDIKVDESQMELMKQMMMKAVEGKKAGKALDPMFDSTGNDDPLKPEKPLMPAVTPPPPAQPEQEEQK